MTETLILDLNRQAFGIKLRNLEFCKDMDRVGFGTIQVCACGIAVCIHLGRCN